MTWGRTTLRKNLPLGTDGSDGRVGTEGLERNGDDFRFAPHDDYLFCGASESKY